MQSTLWLAAGGLVSPQERERAEKASTAAPQLCIQAAAAAPAGSPAALCSAAACARCLGRSACCVQIRGALHAGQLGHERPLVAALAGRQTSRERAAAPPELRVRQARGTRPTAAACTHWPTGCGARRGEQNCGRTVVELRDEQLRERQVQVDQLC